MGSLCENIAYRCPTQSRTVVVEKMIVLRLEHIFEIIYLLNQKQILQFVQSQYTITFRIEIWFINDMVKSVPTYPIVADLVTYLKEKSHNFHSYVAPWYPIRMLQTFTVEMLLMERRS